ncbi:MAG: N-acetylmuramoyl-L-alanine amidase [Lachnospiraceae bacterium]|nr:N-acetylmuramoyl-L-alanine amidase [Lachnospiraceae bacterium]
MKKKLVFWSVVSALIIVALTVALIVIVDRVSRPKQTEQVTAKSIQQDDTTETEKADETEQIEKQQPKKPAINQESKSEPDTEKTEEKEEPEKKGHIVVIDPGHQAHGDSSTEPLGPGSSTKKAKVTGGAHGTTTGVYEYELTLSIGKKLKSELESRGYEVYLTRDSNDVKISNAERAQFATKKNADIYLRLHANGAGGSSANGAMMLYPTSSNQWVGNLSSQSEKLSTDILTAYCKSTGMKNLGNSPRDDMTGFNWATMPMTLIEMGFMTNPTDDRNMEDSSYQAKMVTGIANGIDNYFKD